MLGVNEQLHAVLVTNKIFREILIILIDQEKFTED